MGKSGFTLLELVLVIAIILVLTGAIIPVFNATRRQTQEAKALAELDNIKTAVLMFRGDTNTWPPTGDSGAGLVNDFGVSGWDGPYLSEWKTDPWGNPYQITNCSDGLCANSTNATGVNISLIIISDRGSSGGSGPPPAQPF